MSVTVTGAAVVAAVPSFPTDTVYVAGWPTSNVPVCDLVTIRFGTPPTVVGSVAVGEFGAPPPDAVALLTTEGTAATRTFTTKLNGGAVAPGPMMAPYVHETT